MQDESGRPFMHGIGYDITERKRIEEDMRLTRDNEQRANRAKSEGDGTLLCDIWRWTSAAAAAIASRPRPDLTMRISSSSVVSEVRRRARFRRSGGN
jgi:hypothetical protein